MDGYFYPRYPNELTDGKKLSEELLDNIVNEGANDLLSSMFVGGGVEFRRELAKYTGKILSRQEHIENMKFKTWNA